MTCESVEMKAGRLILTGRVALQLVHRGRVHALVRGDSGVSYHCGRDPRRGWWCHCEHLGERCSHITALKLVVDLARIDTEPPGRNADLRDPDRVSVNGTSSLPAQGRRGRDSSPYREGAQQ